MPTSNIVGFLLFDTTNFVIYSTHETLQKQADVVNFRTKKCDASEIFQYRGKEQKPNFWRKNH